MDKYNGLDDKLSQIEEFSDMVGLTDSDKSDLLTFAEKRWRTSLTQILDEALPKIRSHDPDFFKSQGIDLPENIQEHLTSVYGDRGEDIVEKAIQSAKVRFGFLATAVQQKNASFRSYLIKDALPGLKKLLDGNYF